MRRGILRGMRPADCPALRQSGTVILMTEPFDEPSLGVEPGPAQAPPHRRTWPILAAMAAVLVVAVAVAAFVVVRRWGGSEVTLGVRPGPIERDTSETIKSIEQFWKEALPATYNRRFVRLRGGFQPKTSASPPFSCAGQPQTYAAIKGNAFYCGGPNDDYIAWDAESLFPQVNNVFGSIAPAIVLSHEMGHAIQARAGVRASSIVMESQADCFAGAWSAFAARSDGDPVQLDDAALDGAIAAIITLRDQPGTAAINPQAHGTGFDRVNSFQTGFEGGPQRCARFATEGVTTTELPFNTAEDLRTGGNLRLEQAVPLLTNTLDAFWTANITAFREGATFQPPQQAPIPSPPLPECPDKSVAADRGASYCPSTNTVSWADSVLRSVHEQVGDMASGTILSDQWGRAGQVQAGVPVNGRDAGLQRDCMTGAWIGKIGDEGLAGALLSPGDVDEALSTIIVSSFAVEGSRESRGSAFTRTQAFRAGVLNGARPCQTIAQSL